MSQSVALKGKEGAVRTASSITSFVRAILSIMDAEARRLKLAAIEAP